MQNVVLKIRLKRLIKNPHRQNVAVFTNINTYIYYIPLEYAEGGMLFSNQNRSPFFKIWNCWPSKHPKVGPTTAPDKGLSARPPTKRSMSSTC